MSGGHFGYKQYMLHDIASQIADLIAGNDDPTGRGYSPDTIDRFREAVSALRIAEVYAQRVDWLVSCDDGEDRFHRRLADDLASLPAQD